MRARARHSGEGARVALRISDPPLARATRLRLRTDLGSAFLAQPSLPRPRPDLAEHPLTQASRSYLPRAEQR